MKYSIAWTKINSYYKWNLPKSLDKITIKYQDRPFLVSQDALVYFNFLLFNWFYLLQSAITRSHHKLPLSSQGDTLATFTPLHQNKFWQQCNFCFAMITMLTKMTMVILRLAYLHGPCIGVHPVTTHVTTITKCHLWDIWFIANHPNQICN